MVMDSPYFLLLLAVALLIGISAFFSAAETGITAVSRAKIHRLKSSGDRKAKLVSKLRSDKDGLIGTILLGNNTVNILASALATSVAIKAFGDQGVAYATVAMTLLVLVFGEVIPKTYAFHNAEKVALNVAPVLKLLVMLFKPFTKAVQVMVDMLMFLFGMSKHSGTHTPSVDELMGAIDMHHQEGNVIKNEKDMLQSILALSAMEVQEVMVHRKNIFSLDASLPPTEIITLVLDSTHTRVPLWEGKPDNIVGMLHTKALLKALQSYDGDLDKLNILDVATKPWFVPETNTLSNQLYQFKSKRNHIALVVDEYGALVGLVTLEDVLEEIVGHIDDELDHVSYVAKKLKSGGYRIKGEMTIRDVNRQLDWKLPDEHATTMAGLVMHESETIPAEGQEFVFYGHRFKVEKVDKNQIVSLVVRPKRTLLKKKKQ